MKLFLLLLLILVTTAFSFQLYHLIQQQSELKMEVAKISQKALPIDQDNQQLTADLEYFKKPEHLENELRKSGYAKPDEKILIIIPEE